ncbi:Qat anti-phage system ATPase QatA [Longitalea luteola]|uniref:Qat anti-phage system ATPase QatA n=1 Tax=Longitalea luteola TaxID=2812563 RepID=UPI001A95A04F|nr:Qat anti-phage system ATPase QatA [Longitalea luteola]
MWNDKETDIDLLGHDKIALTILDIIEDQNLRPLTIGIYGDWGVGKSSILSILQDKAKATANAGIYKHHCIMFNGWLFQGYEDAKTALMETVVTQITDLKTLTAKGKDLAKKIIKRVNWLKVAKVSAGAALTALTGIPAGGLIRTVFEKAKEATASGEDESWTKEVEDEDSVTKQIHAFRKDFADLVKESKVDHVIIMIDDLDRCLPKTVIEILEAIRLFLFVEGTSFVISADERMIEYAVREHFPNLPLEYREYTRNYLEKLVQIPVRMPALTSLQTGNYIKLLMVQFYLKSDGSKMAIILESYEKKKKRPYDNLVLSYEIIKEALGASDKDIETAITVADQITPTLAANLRGNPRNIKRFLNTLFLRLRIARIYGLDTEIQLSRLAKLMLLERFHPALYETVVAEVSQDNQGHSKTINDAEAKGSSTAVDDEQVSDAPIEQQSWAGAEPKIGAFDLRPYIFISREKAISFAGEDQLSDPAVQIYEKLKSGSDIALKAAEKALGQLQPAEITQIFDRLIADSRSIEDFRTNPAPIKGLLRIIAADISLEERLLNRVESISPSKMGAWCTSEFDGLKTEAAKAKYQRLLEGWANQTANRTLQRMAQQKIAQKSRSSR